MIIRLSRDTRRHARTVINRFSLLNAMAFSLMVDITVFLLALHYGASDILMGFLYAASFLSGLALLPVPRLLKGVETTLLFRRCWFARSWICMLYLLLPILSGDNVRCWFLAVIFFAFMVLRNIGVTAVFTLYRAIASSAEMPGMMADIFSRSNLGQILMRSFAFIFMGGILAVGGATSGNQTQAWRLIALLGIGSAFSLASAVVLRGLPASGTIDESATLMGGIRGAYDVLRDKRTRDAGIMSFVFAILCVALSYHVNYLRNVAVVNGSFIFLLQLIALTIGIPINLLLRSIGPRIHLRTLLLAASGLLIPAGITWCCLPATSGAVSALGIVIFYLILVLPLGIVMALALRLQSESLPQERNMELSVGYVVLGALGSLIAIALLAALGALRKHFPSLYPHPYSHAFVIVTGMAAFLCLVARRIPDIHGQRGEYRELLQLMPTNLLTLFRAHRAETSQKQEGKHFALENLMRAPSWAGRGLLLENLQSPEFLRRYSAIRMIKASPDPAAYDVLIRVATDDFDPLQAEAITALGFMNRPEACERLRPILSNPAETVRASTLKTLTRLNHRLPNEELLSITCDLSTFRQRMEVYIGLADMLQVELLLKLMAEEFRSRPPPIRSATMLELVCVSFGAHADFNEVFAMLPNGVSEAIAAALDSAPATWDRNAITRLIQNARQRGDYVGATVPLRPYLGAASEVDVFDDTTLVGITLIAALHARSHNGHGPLESDREKQ